mgnify:CR=1 FL=1
MPTQTTTPSFLATARAFYGEAFDHKKKSALSRSMAEWAEMEEDEQSFAVAHLAFLNLKAEAATQRLLMQVRDLLDEVAESLTVALEESLPAEREETEEELPPEVDDVLPDEVVAAEEEPVGDDGGEP